MKLTELFTGQKQITDTGKLQTNNVKNDAINRQIQSMVPGQTIQGEVVSRNGSEVQIRLSEDMVLQAKLDQNMNLEIGKSMTFEVKNNGKTLTLSPLFTNMATDANVLKALDMASLPVNGTTVSMTKQLMEAGLSIDRNSLQQVYREVNMFPEAQTSDIVNLHKLQMPVNESNVTQMASYRNLTYQLVTGLNNVLDSVPEMFAYMMETGNTEGAVKLYQQIASLVQEMPTDGTISDGMTNPTVVQPEGSNIASTILGNGAISVEASMLEMPEMNMADGTMSNKVTFIEESLLGSNVDNGNVNAQGTGISHGDVAALNAQITHSDIQGKALQDISPQTEESAMPTNEMSAFNSTMNAAKLSENSTIANQSMQLLRNVLAQLPTDFSQQNLLAYINSILQQGGSEKDILNPLLNLLKKQWTITPEEVADAEKVEKLYSKLDRQLKDLAQTMENLGQTSSTTYKAVSNLSQNLDFMQQVNQLYTYVQLPLRLQQGEAHGDLYVYTNKKHLAAKDGKISALLHLDMENLGPVDVYVSMVHDNVSTKFYLKDDDMLDFVMEHIDILTERLQKRGYQCSYEMKVREQEEGQESAVQKLLQQEKQVPLAEYAFDVRT